MRLIEADALKEVFKEKSSEAVCGVELCKAIISQIDNQPTVEAEPKWIPVSKRLPETIDAVNVTWINRQPESYYADIKDKPFTGTAHYCKGKWWWDSCVCQDYLNEYGNSPGDEVDEAIEIVAWMPLPKPYERKEE